MAIGTSDTHDTDDFAGNPRTWVRAEAIPAAIDAALLAGRAVASGGPFVTLGLVSGDQVADIGETLVPDGPITATLSLQAPAWMGLGELVVVVDGEEVWTEDVSATMSTDGAIRIERQIPVTPAAFVVALHRGAATSWPGIHRDPDVVTNPVFVGN